jgi:hypothetical protein
MRDNLVLAYRIRALGTQFFDVRERLQGNPKRKLKELAAGFMEKYHLHPMDRLEKRTFNGIVVWFCESNVLGLLDCEDARKLRSIEAESIDSWEESLSAAIESTIDLSAHSEDGMANMGNDIAAFDFDFGY